MATKSMSTLLAVLLHLVVEILGPVPTKVVLEILLDLDEGEEGFNKQVQDMLKMAEIFSS